MLTRQQFTQRVLPFILRWEGGFVNDPDDAGGVTYRGITRKNNPEWPGWTLIDKLQPLRRNQIVPELEPDVASYYWQRFRQHGFDRISSPRVALAMFDYNVHGGFNLGVMQRIIRDRFGKTVSAGQVAEWVNRQDESAVTSAILEHRSGHLARIVSKNPSQRRFRSGWNRRLGALREYLNLRAAGLGAGLALTLAAAILLIILRTER